MKTTAIILLLGASVALGSHHYVRASRQPLQSPKGAEQSMPLVRPDVLAPPAAILPRYTNRFYFVATAVDANNLGSDYSNEVELSATNQPRALLAWDASPSPAVTNYLIWRGRKSVQYTKTFNAGTNLSLSVPLYDPRLSNIVITVTGTNGMTDFAFATSLEGPWTRAHATNWVYTNPPMPLYFRGIGRKGNEIQIEGKHF